MNSRLRDRVEAAFAEAYGLPPARLFEAPGRVNLIGEHTDYEEGFVLPCAIDRTTIVAARPTADAVVRVAAADESATDVFAVNAPIEKSDQGWANYVRGVAAELVSEGHRLSGAQFAIAGDVPQGAGLSSSASLEIAAVFAMTSLAALNLAPVALAQIGRQAENGFVGCECGIMDQLAAVNGKAGHALLIDCRSLDCRPLPLPGNSAIVIVHSGVRHHNAEGGYNERRRQCREAAAHYRVQSLRDLDVQRLVRETACLDPILLRRARHVVSENERVLAAAEALRAANLAVLGRLMAESHTSMRDDFEITTPEIDRLADIMNAAIGEAGGARMTGGGFGGCVVAVTSKTMTERLCEVVSRDYQTPQGGPPDIFVVAASEGAREIPF